MNEAYLCLGGNLGNCTETFTSALKLLEREAIRVLKCSSVYSSPAWGMDKAPGFYNQVIMVKTGHPANDLMKILLKTEKSLGRERDESGIYQSRPIDLDILFFNDEIIDSKELKVPHPRLHLRRFVLEPLNEIASGLVHPVLNKTVAELLGNCEDKGTVKRLDHAV